MVFFSKTSAEVFWVTKADFVGHIADPESWILKEIFRLLDAQPGDVVHKVEPGGPLEQHAEIARTDIPPPRDLTEGKLLSKPFVDNLPGSRYRRIVRRGAL